MRELKLVHAADLHLDSAFESLPKEKAEQRRAQQRTLLKKLAELAESRGAQAILLSGDVFESGTIYRQTQEEFLKAFAPLSMPVIVAPGNHDPYSPGGLWDAMTLPENVFVLKNEDIKPLEFLQIGLRVWGAGFQDTFSTSLLKAFSAPEKKEDVFDVMLLHGEVCAGKSDYNAIGVQELAESGMDYVALGHIHKRSELMKAGGTAYAWPGCSEGRGYDETGECGAYLVTLSDSGVTAEFVPLGGVRYEIFTVDVSEKPPLEAVSQAAKGLSENDYCRIILTGECEALPDTAALRKSLEARFAELQIKDETVQKRDIWQLTGQDTLSGLYLSKLKDKLNAAASERERQIIELAAKRGLAAIENGGRK